MDKHFWDFWEQRAFVFTFPAVGNMWCWTLCSCRRCLSCLGGDLHAEMVFMEEYLAMWPAYCVHGNWWLACQKNSDLLMNGNVLEFSELWFVRLDDRKNISCVGLHRYWEYNYHKRVCLTFNQISGCINYLICFYIVFISLWYSTKFNWFSFFTD